MKRLAVIAGAGGALGPSLFEALAAKDWRCVGISRSGQNPSLAAAAQPLEMFGGDLADPEFMAQAKAQILQRHGTPELLIYNAHQLLIRGFLETSFEEFRELMQSNTFGAFLAAKAFLPGMLELGRGTIMLTGATAALRGSAKFAAFATSKFALRGLGQSLAREFGPRGVHVAHVVIDGLIWGDKARDFHQVERSSCIEPAQIAKTYMSIIEQDRSAWTQELDIRPLGGKF